MNGKKIIKTDIHVHTCLSPCADIVQSPKRVVERAYEKGLNIIFITDHNTMENVEAAMNVAKKYDTLSVYPGMEITTREEIHVLSLFDNIKDAKEVETVIYENLPDSNIEKEIQLQIIANEYDEVEGYCKKSLFSAVDMGIKEVIELIHNNKGVAIAAHIDRESFSVISQLGAIPDYLQFNALEISPNLNLEEAKIRYKEYSYKYKFVRGSDAHFISDIGKSQTEFYGKDYTYKNFVEYLNG